MKLEILRPEHANSVARCFLTHDANPLAMFAMRKHFEDYHLSPDSKDGLLIGEVTDAGSVVRMFTVTVRSSELVLRNPLGVTKPDEFTEALQECRIIAIYNGYKRVIHTLLPVSLVDLCVDVEAWTKLGFVVTKTFLHAGEHPEDKTFWWNTMNRSTVAHDLLFYKLEF